MDIAENNVAVGGMPVVVVAVEEDSAYCTEFQVDKKAAVAVGAVDAVVVEVDTLLSVD
jgi:hypothetical protein